MKKDRWKYYFPEDGETVEDAREFPARTRVIDAEDAAHEACVRDFNDHDGWERGCASFIIAVISPDGVEEQFNARHEESVEHRVSKRTLGDRT
jgi:hypothetical protein